MQLGHYPPLFPCLDSHFIHRGTGKSTGDGEMFASSQESPKFNDAMPHKAKSTVICCKKHQYLLNK